MVLSETEEEGKKWRKPQDTEKRKLLSFNNKRTRNLGKDLEMGCSTIIHSSVQPAFTESKEYRDAGKEV